MRARDISTISMEKLATRRRRPALSCVGCRRRKVKCDRNDPCAPCVSARTQCTYKAYRNEFGVRQQPQQASSPSSATNAPASLLQPEEAIAAIAAAGISGVPNTLGRSNILSQNQDRDIEPNLQNLLHRVKKLEESSLPTLTHEPSETSRQILARQFGLQDSQIFLNKTRILRWSHWMGMAPEFTTIFTCYKKAPGNGKGAIPETNESTPLLAKIGHLLLKCKILAGHIKSGRPSRFVACPDFNFAPPSREMADIMAALYFQSFESTHRILHIPTFWTEYQKYWNHPQAVTIGLRLKVLLVIGIGSSLHTHGTTDVVFRNMVHQWIHAAQMWLSGPLDKDRLNITGIQINCLTILARQIFSIGGDLISIAMGTLTNSAIQIGLHRDPKYLPAMSVLQAELRRRLWATILEMIVQSSLDSAIPTRISLDDFDTEAPSNINDDEINESTTVVPNRSNETHSSTSMQIILLKSLPIRLRVLRLLNDLRSELSYQDVLDLSSEINKTCGAHRGFKIANGKSSLTPFHRNLLEYLVRRFLLPLHCAYARKARTNPLFYHSRKVSLETAMAIILPEPDEGFAHLMAIGGGLFREGLMLAAFAISIELIAQTEDQRKDGTLHCMSQYREPLKLALRNVILISLQRIRHGETSIKTHLFLSMVLAQAEAMEAGTSCELKIAQSAVDSLELCHELLLTQVGTVPMPCLDNLGATSIASATGQEGYGLGLDLDLDMDLEFFFSDASAA